MGLAAEQAPPFLPGLPSVGANQLSINWEKFPSVVEVSLLSWGVRTSPQGAQPPGPTAAPPAADISPLAFILIHLGVVFPPQDQQAKQQAVNT